MQRISLVIAMLAALLFGAHSAAAGQATHAIAMHGQPALPPDFQSFPYARPDAPKGGTLRLGELGSFDSMNPYILKGVAANGVREYVYEGLLVRSADEPFTLYAHLARAIEMPDDRSSVTFELDPDARFSDGHPVTPDDVIFSWQLLKEKGQPYQRLHFSEAVRAVSPAPGRVRFDLKADVNREAPLLIALMPILPKHLIDPERFTETTLAAPVGSGPYLVSDIDPGRSVVFTRNPDWWARNKPASRGRFNFDRIRFDYVRDQATLFEAFKSGEVDIRVEDDAGRWADAYDFPAVHDGRVRKAELPTAWPAGMSALVFNTRRPIFADKRVREALTLIFDFEWINRNLFHGLYSRTQSYFERSDLSSFATPADETERQLLSPYPGAVDPDILEGRFAQPATDGTGRNRENLKAALQLLKDAGYQQVDGRMVEKRSGTPLQFEMMAAKRAEERLFQAYAQSLARVGIEAQIRSVDSAQRWARFKSFDFDMIQWTWATSLSPGNEQRNRWSATTADSPNTLNFAGVRSAAADAMIDALLAARERPEFISAVRALDRVLLSGRYVIPLYYPKRTWVAWRSSLERPERTPLQGLAIDTWWTTRR